MTRQTQTELTHLAAQLNSLLARIQDSAGQLPDEVPSSRIMGTAMAKSLCDETHLDDLIAAAQQAKAVAARLAALR
ncbi:MAG: hypothetical protein KC620_26255 [Myxococcales bacterium]|nr:hypothetical protein [Myxococcales bacterium]